MYVFIKILSHTKTLVFHLKRFSNTGRFSYGAMGDKIDSFVDAPIRNLDLSRIVKGLHTGPLSTEGQPSDLIYDLYAVSNHFGGLGGGHCEFLWD